MKKSMYLLLITPLFMAFFISACHEGPAQKAGEKVDEITEIR